MFPLFYLISSHLHFLDTSPQLNTRENILRSASLKRLLTVSNRGDYIPNILCTARPIKLQYYIPRTLAYEEMDSNVGNTITYRQYS